MWVFRDTRGTIISGVKFETARFVSRRKKIVFPESRRTAKKKEKKKWKLWSLPCDLAQCKFSNVNDLF